VTEEIDMQQQMILDKLSEFLMVEQGGLELYRVAAARSVTPTLRTKYDEFGRETARHREVLVALITALGGDVDYVSPTARLVQYKASKLLGSAVHVDGLGQAEIELNDLENVLIAETMDHANWQLLALLADQESGDMQTALLAAVEEVEQQEDEHLEWARETLAQLSWQMLNAPQAPDPARWQELLTGPEPPITAFHPVPFEDGLLEGASLPVWIETPISRSMRASGSVKAR
jgi:rubrerythrin